MKALTVVLSSLLICSITALLLPAELWWGLAFLGVLVPLLWFLNLLILLYWLRKPSRWTLVSAIAVLSGLGLLFDTVAYPFGNEDNKQSLQVLSYNVSHFGKPRNYHLMKDSGRIANKQQTRAFIEWVVNHPAPIKCIQEFYTFYKNPIYDVDAKLRSKGWNASFISADTLSINKSRFGLAIYSKYELLDKGIIFIGSSRFNRGIWADLLVGRDTLRVINVHFQSAQLQRTKSRSAGKKEALTKMFWMYRSSLQERNIQLKKLHQFIEASPHPLLLCGDLNSTPYSHVYQGIDARLQNAFERKGSGFGFTFNHPWLNFLRIDHQFASPEINITDFKTRQDVSYSAHYPLEGWYSIKKN